MAEDKNEDGPTTPTGEVSSEMMQEAFSGPAFYSNRVFSTQTAIGLRLTFAEQSGEIVPPMFRTAVVLSFPDAVALRDLLNRQVAEFESVAGIEIEVGPDGKPVIKNA